MDVDTAYNADDDDSWDSQLGEDSTTGPGESEEITKLRRELEAMQSILSGITQAKSFGSDDGSKSAKHAGNLKKMKTNDGYASSNSIAGDSKASRRSTGTRGTKARDDKRKKAASGAGDEAIRKKAD
ncbi:hypothetical protein SEMRO_243_G097030.1 [Seminavis robusta]|uniref:Uncharacterized protein n=1 Tax=Seminavis robusta TaxID=568900 RepID=A0A9N8DND4_9STRA|nr:hypothetical protein SEMRO_243_G097030.1 [Seminavis robusta]|eukprot:Sro243_g097030.1 n/a (127) ;mRNA; r:81391-81771